ncbi:MAG: hypothetical protein R3C99_06870 [Pirellulaceae bacterium]
MTVGRVRHDRDQSRIQLEAKSCIAELQPTNGIAKQHPTANIKTWESETSSALFFWGDINKKQHGWSNPARSANHPADIASDF